MRPSVLEVVDWVKANVEPNHTPPRFAEFSKKMNRRIRIGHRDGWTCRYCNQVTTFRGGTLDHIVPVSKGGTNAPKNLCWACKPCNRKKGDKLLEAYA